MPSLARILLAAAALTAASPSSPAIGQTPPAPAAAPAPTPPVIPLERQSPRAVLRAFFTRMVDNDKAAAAKLLDLSALNAEAASAKGPELSYKLFETMRWLVRWPDDRGWPPSADDDFLLVPDDPEYPEPWRLAELERYAEPRDGADRVQIVRGDDGAWSFSAQTVAAIEPLYLEAEAAAVAAEKAAAEARAGSPPAPEDAGEERAPKRAEASRVTPTWSIWFRNLFPPILRQQRFLLPDYQWVCLLVLAVLGRVVERGGRWTLTAVADRVLRWAEPDFQETTERVWRPVGRLAHAATWYYGAYLIGLPVEVVNLLLLVLRFVMIIAAVGAAYAVINLVAGYFTRRARRNEKRFDDMIVPLAATTLKILFTLGSVLALIAAFNEELPSTLLGGLGIGGIAFALASQETLSNFFGSLTLLFDRPFEVGDWIVVEGIEGEVESVGFRSTKIRTGPNSQITLPNNKLATAAIDNLGRRRFRRYLTRLGVEYGTEPERIDAFCEGIRELIRRHPHTRKDFYAVNFNEFGASALEILLVVFFEAPDWATELRERHRLLGDIARLAKQLGVEFAFPTQTLHLQRGEKASPRDTPVDPDRAGQLLAAEIAGELPNYQDRPGRVKFGGPTRLDPPPA